MKVWKVIHTRYSKEQEKWFKEQAEAKRYIKDQISEQVVDFYRDVTSTKLPKEWTIPGEYGSIMYKWELIEVFAKWEVTNESYLYPDLVETTTSYLDTDNAASEIAKIIGQKQIDRQQILNISTKLSDDRNTLTVEAADIEGRVLFRYIAKKL